MGAPPGSRPRGVPVAGWIASECVCVRLRARPMFSKRGHALLLRQSLLQLRPAVLPSSRCGLGDRGRRRAISWASSG